MNLAPHFPDDHAMHLLMQLLHEELGLPERKTISLTTSINFDLGCDGADARHCRVGLVAETVRITAIILALLPQK
jgi:hypothetical protein